MFCSSFGEWKRALVCGFCCLCLFKTCGRPALCASQLPCVPCWCLFVASFLFGGLCCKYTAFSLLLQRIGGKSVHAGAFFAVRANGLRALACRKRTKLWRASGCVNKRKVRAFPSVCVTHWFTACCVTDRFALQNGSFWAAKRAVSGGETARLGKRNGRRRLAAWPHYGLLTVSAILGLASFVNVLPRREAGGCAEVFGEEGGVGEVEPVAHLLDGV